MLRNAGLSEVYLLDGGLAAWRGAGFGVESGERQAEPGDVVLTGGAMPVIDAGQAASWGRHGLLLDARAGERYRGDFEPVDPRAGHIPGAVSAPTTGNLGADGRFLSPAALRERFTGLGVRADVPTAVYRGSGVTAAHEIASASKLPDSLPALYPGSFSEWSQQRREPSRDRGCAIRGRHLRGIGGGSRRRNPGTAALRGCSGHGNAGSDNAHNPLPDGPEVTPRCCFVRSF